MSEIVYIFTNPAMPGFIKIGRTSRDDVRERLKELSDPSGVPMPFECLYAAEVADAKKVESAIHDAFDCDRVNPKREFFTTSPERIITLLRAHEISDKTPSTQKILDEITSLEDKSAQAVANRSRLKFSDIGILPGEELALKDDPAKKCRVVDDRQVDYEGTIFPSLADLARGLGIYDEGWESAPMLFTYKDERLCDIRKRLKSER